MQSIVIEERAQGDAVVLKPIGRLDSITTPDMQDKVSEVLARQPSCLVIDFGAVDYINSTGLRIMLMAAKKLKVASGRLVLCGMRASVRSVFELSGFHKIITIVDECSAAAKA